MLAHGEVYAEEFGWTTDFEALVARIVADYAAGHDPAREGAWIAERDGRRVGCIFCVTDPDDPATAKLRILLVHPDGRGRGSAGGSWTPAWSSRGLPATRACDCGRTTR